MDDGRRAAGGWKIPLLAGLVGILIGAGAMLAANGYLIRSYLLSHPEVLPEAMERLRARETASAVETSRAALERPYHGAWAGAADGDVVLVQFFDYACGFCRASNADVDRLLREDPRLKVVWREFPVLGPDSEAAAFASLAAARINRFRPFHERLFASGRPTAERVAATGAALGIAAAAPAAEARREIERNYELGRAVGATGTPTFVVGDQVLQGAVGYEALRDAIAAARAG